MLLALGSHLSSDFSCTRIVLRREEERLSNELKSSSTKKSTKRRKEWGGGVSERRQRDTSDTPVTRLVRSWRGIYNIPV